MKKIFLLLITLVMVMPSMARTLYLHPNANWMQQGGDGGDPQQFSVPRFAAYVWDDNGNQWFDMVPAEEGFYKVEVPDNYVNLIFTRMTPFVKENNWDQKWNQTENLTIGKGNCYYVEENTWDNGKGSWEWHNALTVPFTADDATNKNYATVFADYALDLPEGVHAYTGSINADHTQLLLTEVPGGKVIPAKTGVVLTAANAAEYLFMRNFAEDVQPITGNILLGSFGEGARPTGCIVCTLQKRDGHIGFYKYSGGSMKPNRAYFTLPESVQVQGLHMVFVDEVTGIDNVATEINAHQTIYDLSGRAVKQVKQSGIYIVNGQKVFVK